MDWATGTGGTAYGGVTPDTRAEAEAYQAAFAEEDAQFPELFSQVIQDWLARQGL